MKPMETKTAVEWLQQAISIHLTHEQIMAFEGLFQQAIEMEKERLRYERNAGFIEASGFKTRRDSNDDAHDQRYT
jgi:hypothetical protein